MRHNEYTIFKKESGNFIIRYMFAPLKYWAKEYKDAFNKGRKKIKPYLVVKYPKNKDSKVPRRKKNKKGHTGNRGQFISSWTKHWFYNDGEKAANKYNKL